MPHYTHLHLIKLILFVLLLATVQACSTYKTIDIDSAEKVNFQQHAQNKQNKHLSVNVAILTDKEADATFGLSFKLAGIQTLWVSVENKDDSPYWLLYPAIDENYFSPDEVAYAYSSIMSEQNNHQLMQQLRQQSFKNPVHPGETKSGFIFINLDEDYKSIDIELLGNNKLDIFNFLFTISGLNYQNFDEIVGIHSQDQLLNVDEESLTKKLKELPCCTTNKDATQNGDPLNLVFIGNAEDLFPAFAHRGWHPAEKNYWDSARKTLSSFFFGQHYRYSPVSPLYALGRKQDIALQKARGTIHQRKHLRLWLTTLTYQGKSVWLGQVSRDIGIRFTSKTPILVTHKIDPDIDEARNELIQEMIFSQGLKKIGFIDGVPVSTAKNPAYNLTGDPYFNDGLRAVLLMQNKAEAIKNVQFFNWTYSLPDARHLNNTYTKEIYPVKE